MVSQGWFSRGGQGWFPRKMSRELFGRDLPRRNIWCQNKLYGFTQAFKHNAHGEF